ncbi:MAG: uL15 family ribosomal protein [Candidatus Paceibacterota bacterium]
MNLSELKSRTPRKSAKRIGRGGKRGTFSGKGSKGQKSRAGIKLGFRGGDNRIWQLFPKQKGASKKPGSNKPHFKHRFYQSKGEKHQVFNLDFFNMFDDGQIIDLKFLIERGLVKKLEKNIKILGSGDLKKKLEFKGFEFSKSAKNKITKIGAKISNE